DQPDVEASKIATRKLTTEYEQTGPLPPETHVLEADGMKFFTDARNAAALQGKTAVEMLRSHLNRLGAGDYFALLGYIQMNAEHEEDLQEMGRDVSRLRSALSPFHGAGVQGRSKHGSVPAAHLRRHARPRDSRRQIHCRDS